MAEDDEILQSLLKEIERFLEKVKEVFEVIESDKVKNDNKNLASKTNS